MLSTLRSRPFSDKEWLYGWKLDGFRCLVRKSRERVDLLSREGNRFNGSFPDIVDAVAAVPGDFVWDAELAVGAARGKHSFSSLQERARTTSLRNVPTAARRCPARLYIFDMMLADGVDQRGRPLIERKDRLRDAFDDTSTLIYVTHVEGVGELVFEQVQLHDFEGMVAKRTASPYVRGRSLNWIKVKNAQYSRPEALGFGRK